MTPRESARILSLLNTSFKRQLDLQDPRGLPSSEQQTHRHLQSVLTNPLFAIHNDAQGSGEKVKSKVFGQVQNLVKRPMDVFKEQVSAGTATVQSAGLCLQAEHNKCLASCDLDLVKAMRASKAGTTVLEWVLLDVGRWRLVDKQSSMNILVSFLVAEGQHEQILQWLQVMSIEARKNQEKAITGRFQRLLYEFIKAEISLGQGLESATSLFVQAASGVRDDGLGFHGLKYAFHTTAYILTIKLVDMPKSKELQKATLDPFINMSKHFAKSNSIVPALQRVYLAMHPNPDAALRYFWHLSQHMPTPSKPQNRSSVIFLGLRTAELCLDQYRQAEAVQVMEYLQQNFRDEIAPRQIPRADRARRGSREAEHESLRLLDSLAIA